MFLFFSFSACIRAGLRGFRLFFHPWKNYGSTNRKTANISSTEKDCRGGLARLEHMMVFLIIMMKGFRKNSLRLKSRDYALPGPYFFTLCTHGHLLLFEDNFLRERILELAKIIAVEHKIAVNAIVVACDHIHGIITLPDDHSLALWNYLGIFKVRISQLIRGQASLPLQKLQKRTRIWQRSYYDHIIRDENDFFTKAKYIEQHPFKENGTIFLEWH